jgi:hypothetical protein
LKFVTDNHQDILTKIFPATSSMESEYMAVYGGIQELVWIRGVCVTALLFGKSTPFYIDSQGAEDLIEIQF